MLLREVEYARPDSVDEAVRLLSSREDARVLAGGQSLVNVMKTRVAAPELVVDLNRIAELREISTGPDGSLVLGAMVTYDELIRSDAVLTARPILAEVALTIADVQVRNRGTVGGNLCVNDPTNHLPPLMATTGATMTIRALEAERTGQLRRVLPGRLPDGGRRPGEMLTRVTVPALAAGEGDGWASVTLGKDGHRNRQRRRHRSRRAGAHGDRLRLRGAHRASRPRPTRSRCARPWRTPTSTPRRRPRLRRLPAPPRAGARVARRRAGTGGSAA